jgi:hypothetical protein
MPKAAERAERVKAVETRRREIAPRLADGSSRVDFGHGLPPVIREGLRLIAEEENRSQSYLMEQWTIDKVIEWFRRKRRFSVVYRPRYKRRKRIIDSKG